MVKSSAALPVLDIKTSMLFSGLSPVYDLAANFNLSFPVRFNLGVIK